MNSPVEQGVLALARQPDRVEVPIEIVMARRDLLGAINLMFDLSGLDDKEIYLTLEIDAGHFSNIRKGKQGCHFPPNKLQAAMDLCRSEIPLIWLARTRTVPVWGMRRHVMPARIASPCHRCARSRR